METRIAFAPTPSRHSGAAVPRPGRRISPLRPPFPHAAGDDRFGRRRPDLIQPRDHRLLLRRRPLLLKRTTGDNFSAARIVALWRNPPSAPTDIHQKSGRDHVYYIIRAVCSPCQRENDGNQVRIDDMPVLWHRVRVQLSRP